jgi:Glycosyl hydrolase family 115/Gylcosyl hydrolase family 115 C-terminal domain
MAHLPGATPTPSCGPVDTLCGSRRSIAGRIVLLALLAYPPPGLAIGQPQYIGTTPVPGGLTLARNGVTAQLYVDRGDDWGVRHAAHELQADIKRVTGRTPPLLESARSVRGNVVLIGTIGRSRLLDRLIREHVIDVASMRGRWESTLTQVVAHPLPGIARALVIAGSDRRGTIYGIYDLSADIGVSPWYWWADVPVPHRETLYARPGRWLVGPPVVRYRGIFLNDEAPSLTGWVKKRYGGYNHRFYTRVFDLLLRLRANYLWPAMWNSAFAVDDPLNAKLANEYGIVMGTSHEEPMMCAEKEWQPGDGPWNYATNRRRIDRFWRHCIARDKGYEEVVTLGMRGHDDTPMSAGDNIALLQRIVADQRLILRQTLDPDLDRVPQVWALYKEVQRYYEQGMRVPDDVTLLWSDDNWGNLRRLPTAAERKRRGGAGIYYHFDYVGGPRSYKWLNTNYVPKIWEQMNLAFRYGATRIWVVNVGDLKPMELPISFFLDMAWNPARFDPDDLQRYTDSWAAQQFGPAHATEIGRLLTAYTKYNGRRKPELLAPDTFSLTHFDEARRVDEEWRSLTRQAQRVGRELPAAYRDAYFELVLYPLQASAIVNELYITAGENALEAKQGRVRTNSLAQEARRLFAEDAALSYQYNHVLAHGKWDHMMDQTHIGYTGWNEPPVNAMPPVRWVQPLAGAHMAVAAQGAATAAAGPSPALRLPTFDDFNRQTRAIDIFNRGDRPFHWSAAASRSWIRLRPDGGKVTQGQRLRVSIDWSQVPLGRQTADIDIRQRGGAEVTVRVTAFHPASPRRESLDGFVEANHYVSIDAAHFTGETSADGVHWVQIPNYGETLSAMTIFPVTAASLMPPRPAPTLRYRVYLFDSGKVSLQAILAPTLNFVPGRGLRYAVSIDAQTPIIVDALADDSQKAWATAVSDGVRKVTTILHVASPGYHTLNFRMIDPGVVLEKLVLAFPHSSNAPRPRAGAMPTGPAVPGSYLGPPESYHAGPSFRR